MVKKGEDKKLSNKKEAVYKYLYNFLNYTNFEAFSERKLNPYGIVWHCETSSDQIEVLGKCESYGTFETVMLINGAFVYAKETPELRAKNQVEFGCSDNFESFIREHSEEIAGFLSELWKH